MFLPLASTMSVFNCRAVGVHAEKTCTRSRQVQGRTEGGLGRGKQLDCTQQCSSQSSCMRFHFAEPAGWLSFLPVFLTPLKRQTQTGDPKALFLFEVWSADLEALRVPILACPEWWDQLFKSLLFLFCSLASLTHRFAEGWPDSPRFSTAAEVLRQAAVFTQFLSFPTLTPSVFLFPFQSLSDCGSALFSPALVLFPLPPLEQSHLQDAVLLCSSTRSADYRGWMGEHRGDREPAPALPPSPQHSTWLSQ